MSGFTGNDGSGLVGGLNPSGAIKALSVDASGNLNVNASVSSGPTNITQINGAALSASNPLFVAQSQGGAVLADTNPEINISNIQQMILNGKGYSCSTGKIAAATNLAGSWFSPNTSAKNKIIWSVRMFYSNANQINEARLITADDANITAGTSVIGQAINLKVGGSAPEAVNAMHYASAVTAPTVGAATEPFDLAEIQAALFLEVIPAGGFIYIPAGTAGGIACYSATTASGSWGMTVRWVEF